MINIEQQKIIDSLTSPCSKDQLIWMSGYLMGIANNKTNIIPIDNVNTSQPIELPNINIYYATETGNTKLLSTSLMKSFRNEGFKVKATSLSSIVVTDLEKDEYSIFLISTHGEGEPPESAVNFVNSIKLAGNNFLPNLKYAVLGLGDKSYAIYCGAALNLDEELQRLGGKIFQDIALFDVDHAEHTQNWINNTVENFKKNICTSAENLDQLSAKTHNIIINSSEPTVRTSKGYSRLHPISGIVKSIVNLNGIGSKKQTYHIEIIYKDDIVFAPGDAVGIILPKKQDGIEHTPRLYSIASSPAFHGQEIHLTVALASYVKDDIVYHGISSSYLSSLKPNDEVNFYIHKNHLFKLPAAEQNLIMIGPGTGIAPFRSFVYERLELSSTGKNWLFFGEQHAHCDFLYQSEWQEHLATGSLDRIDLAFSRDQEHKIYVQDRLNENAVEIVKWLDHGAAIYVCGSKEPMSRDVEQTLINIIATQKSLSLKESKDFLGKLSEENRYLKDVY